MQKLRSLSVLVLSVLLITYISVAIFVGRNVYFDNRQKSDVILVLGAKSYLGDKYNPCLVERVRHGVELYNNRLGEKIIFSGGDDEADAANEALTMSQIASGFEVPGVDMILEDESNSTYENILNSHKIMKSKNYSSTIIVTEPFHSPRAGLIAKHLGVNHTLSPATTSECWSRWKYLSKYFLREPLAIILYFLQGKLNTF